MFAPLWFVQPRKRRFHLHNKIYNHFWLSAMNAKRKANNKKSGKLKSPQNNQQMASIQMEWTWSLNVESSLSNHSFICLKRPHLHLSHLSYLHTIEIGMKAPVLYTIPFVKFNITNDYYSNGYCFMDPFNFHTHKQHQTFLYGIMCHSSGRGSGSKSNNKLQSSPPHRIATAKKKNERNACIWMKMIHSCGNGKKG